MSHIIASRDASGTFGFPRTLMPFSIGVHKSHVAFYTVEIGRQLYMIYPSLHQNNLSNLSSRCLTLTSM